VHTNEHAPPYTHTYAHTPNACEWRCVCVCQQSKINNRNQLFFFEPWNQVAYIFCTLFSCIISAEWAPQHVSSSLAYVAGVGLLQLFTTAEKICEKIRNLIVITQLKIMGIIIDVNDRVTIDTVKT